MKRVFRRSASLWLCIALLSGGFAGFCGQLFTRGEDWGMHWANPHVYERNRPAAGSVLDRDGVQLLRFGADGRYFGEEPLRKSMFHWLGDREGNVSVPAIAYYLPNMMDYGFWNGLYAYGGIGGRLQLTLDSRLQTAAWEAMAGKAGTVALCNYRTGELLCAVSTPSMDPEDQQQPEHGVYVNRFTQGLYIPGSVFKIITTAAALEEWGSLSDWRYTCSGSHSFGTDQVTCRRPHGSQSLQQAMSNSCNCAYARLAVTLGAEKLEAYIRRFGVLKSAQFDGIASARGNVSLLEQSAVEVAWSAIGQHRDQINPCAFLQFLCAIANGGQGPQPYVVKSVRSGGKLTYSAQTKLFERILSKESANQLKKMMANNVKLNYGQENFPGLTVCAKSGTGQVGGSQRPNALFAGFIAEESHPYAFLIVVENGGSGQQVCIPILSEILKWTPPA